GACHNLTCFPPDVKCFGHCDVGVVTIPLMHNDVIKQQPVDFLDVERATDFITQSARKKQPFFLYYPSHHIRYSQYAGLAAAGWSHRGPFGDALLEFDSTVGNLLPELMRMSQGGNAGPLKCEKSTNYEGGIREPAIAY
ncbi:unnamed protein product, partial [Coregonus sp. 'balchen']